MQNMPTVSRTTPNEFRQRLNSVLGSLTGSDSANPELQADFSGSFDDIVLPGVATIVLAGETWIVTTEDFRRPASRSVVETMDANRALRAVVTMFLDGHDSEF